MVVLLIIAQLVVVFVVVVVVKGAVIVVIWIEGISTLFTREIVWLDWNELIIKTLSSMDGAVMKDEDDFVKILSEFKLASSAEDSGRSLVAIVVIKPNGCCWAFDSSKSMISGEIGVNSKSILHNGNSFVDESFE